MNPTALIYSDAGLKHLVPRGHVERPERLEAITSAFETAGLNPPRIEPKPASREDILRVHTAQHYETIHRTCVTGARYDDDDTPMMEQSWDAALLAAGGAIEAARVVVDGEYAHAFSAMRPPGHHAERNAAMGFCLFNSVAVATRWLQAHRGIGKVAILDWDVHHGNGTQHLFYDDPSVYYISLHQHPHYPGTGLPEERGAENTNLNICMPAGTPAQHWMDAIAGLVVPEFERFDPEFVLISCGFDAHRDDPLGAQNLLAEHYTEMTNRIKVLAGGRVASLLEGGYNLHALGECAVAHFRALES